MAKDQDVDREIPPEHVERPQQGEKYRCETCGMEIEIVADCRCDTESGPILECCGEPLNRV